MSFHSPYPQECYFYQGQRNEEIVGVFIRLFMDDVKTGMWVVGCENYQELVDAYEFVNVMMDKTFTWTDVLSLVKLMKKRYETFKHVLETTDVHGDRCYNHVHASPKSWDSFFKV